MALHETDPNPLYIRSLSAAYVVDGGHTIAVELKGAQGEPVTLLMPRKLLKPLSEQLALLSLGSEETDRAQLDSGRRLRSAV